MLDAGPPAIGDACSRARASHTQGGDRKLEEECTQALKALCGSAQKLGTSQCQSCLETNKAQLFAAHCKGPEDWCSTSERGFLSPETYLFARSEYQYMRFGLGFALMHDGYYTHELGACNTDPTDR